jgi:transcriptional regulator with XRE-family HTH domain
MNTFRDWLLEELGQRDWTYSDLARKAGISRGAVGNIARGQRNPGPDICEAIAHAFNYPVEVVYRAAGLLPSLPTQRQAIEEILGYKLAELPPEQLEEVLQFIDWLQQRDSRNASIITSKPEGSVSPSKSFKKPARTPVLKDEP